MKEKIFPLSLYLKHKPNFVLVISSFVINIITWILLMINIKPQEDQIFLHYNALFGVDLIGPWYKVFYLPLSGILILLVNVIIGLMLFRKAKAIGYISGAVSLILQVVILIAAHLLILLNV